MKKALMKISALLLVVWYCLSIIGFDVHTCGETSRSFVHMSFISHSCEDIHDDDHCDSHHEEQAEHHHTDDCCEDEYQVISLTGLRSDDDHNDFGSCDFTYGPSFMASTNGSSVLYAEVLDSKYPDIPDSGLIVPDVQAFLSTWRI